MNKDKELISDDGVVEKTDPCGRVVIGYYDAGGSCCRSYSPYYEGRQ